jgi:hypothetical protein
MYAWRVDGRNDTNPTIAAMVPDDYLCGFALCCYALARITDVEKRRDPRSF